MRILLTGGGTLGSVSPLLALIPQLKEEGHQIQFVGTIKGPERTLVEEFGIPFFSIIAPKFRRYLSWRHLLLPIEFIISIVMALAFIIKSPQDVVVSAGGFVSVPIVWAAWLLRIPAVIHQQDLQPGLANRLMQPFADSITIAFEKSLQDFKGPSDKIIWTGNPVRDLRPTTDSLQLDPSYPNVLIFGGGTGALALNELVSADLCEFANVIHLTGKNKSEKVSDISHARYHQFDFLHQEMAEALQKADVVVARAGLGTITELATLGKAAIIIPMPRTHQEQNAEYLEQQKAAVVLDQEQQDRQSFILQINELLQDQNRRKMLTMNIAKLTKPDAAACLVSIIKKAKKTSK